MVSSRLVTSSGDPRHHTPCWVGLGAPDQTAWSRFWRWQHSPHQGCCRGCKLPWPGDGWFLGLGPCGHTEWFGPVRDNLKILSWWWHLELTWEGLYYCHVIGWTPLGAFNMLGRCSFLSIFDVSDWSSQSQFEDTELVVAPWIHLGGPILLPGDWVDNFRSLQYAGKILLFVNLWY